MNRVPLIFVAVIFIVSIAGFYVKDAYALEETISIDGINYVSLKRMADKYNYALEDKDGLITIVGEAVNLKINKTNNLFTMNGNDFIAQALPAERDGEVWITAKDWAGLFNLSLTHYDGVSQMAPTTTEPVTTPTVEIGAGYQIDSEWGDKIPEGVRKHGSPKNIITPHIEVPVYDSEHSNPVVEEKMQRP